MISSQKCHSTRFKNSIFSLFFLFNCHVFIFPLKIWISYVKDDLESLKFILDFQIYLSISISFTGKSLFNLQKLFNCYTFFFVEGLELTLFFFFFLLRLRVILWIRPYIIENDPPPFKVKFWILLFVQCVTENNLYSIKNTTLKILKNNFMDIWVSKVSSEECLGTSMLETVWEHIAFTFFLTDCQGFGRTEK